MKNIPTVIRIIFTLCLIFAAYKETGVWTGISFFLIFMWVEIQNIINRKVVLGKYQ
jgi:hypothetical protein